MLALSTNQSINQSINQYNSVVRFASALLQVNVFRVFFFSSVLGIKIWLWIKHT
jgi:hypothetical protein